MIPPPTATSSVCRLAPALRILSMIAGDASSDLFASVASMKIAAAPARSNAARKHSSAMIAAPSKCFRLRSNDPLSIPTE